MKPAVVKAIALFALVTLVWTTGCFAADQQKSDWTKPDWSNKNPDWWQAYDATHGQLSSYLEQEQSDDAHFRYWLQHHRQPIDDRDYRWRWTCDQDGDNCRPNPYSYGRNFTPPDSMYYQQYNPSYGYVMPWSFYVTPYR